MFLKTAQRFGFGDSLEPETSGKESDIVRVVSLIVENSKKLRYLEAEVETSPYRKKYASSYTPNIFFVIGDNEELMASLSSSILEINKLIDEMNVPQDRCASEYILDYEDQSLLMKLLKKVSEFNKAYPELMQLLNTGKEDVSVQIERLLNDTEKEEKKLT